MSQANVETFKRGIEAYNRGDIEAAVAVHHPDVEWRPAIQVILGGEAVVYRGHDGVREFLQDTDEAFSEARIELREIRDLGDRLIAEGRWLVRGRESGAETEASLNFLVDFEHGKLSRAVTFLDRNEALEAAGLRD